MAAKIPDLKYSKLSGVEDARHLPPPYRLRRYYTPFEVSQHKTADDCWVSFFNKVYDLTLLIQENHGNQLNLCEPIIKAAGTDITHWFDPTTKEPKTYIHPETNLKHFYCPDSSLSSRFLHIPPIEPDSQW